MTRKVAPLVEVRVGPHEVAVLIRGLPHILLRRAEVLAFQAYIKSEGPAAPMYFLEVTLAGGRAVVSDYDTRTVWEAVIAGLGAAHVFDERLGEDRGPG